MTRIRSAGLELGLICPCLWTRQFPSLNQNFKTFQVDPKDQTPDQTRVWPSNTTEKTIRNTTRGGYTPHRLASAERNKPSQTVTQLPAWTYLLPPFVTTTVTLLFIHTYLLCTPLAVHQYYYSYQSQNHLPHPQPPFPKNPLLPDSFQISSKLEILHTILFCKSISKTPWKLLLLVPVSHTHYSPVLPLVSTCQMYKG